MYKSHTTDQRWTTLSMYACVFDVQYLKTAKKYTVVVEDFPV